MIRYDLNYDEFDNKIITAQSEVNHVQFAEYNPTKTGWLVISRFSEPRDFETAKQVRRHIETVHERMLEIDNRYI